MLGVITTRSSRTFESYDWSVWGVYSFILDHMCATLEDDAYIASFFAESGVGDDVRVDEFRGGFLPGLLGSRPCSGTILKYCAGFS